MQDNTNDETTTATPDPRLYVPTATNMTTGAPAYRRFKDRGHWIDKATTWISPGDVCVDSKGRELAIGRDFAEADYPVFIARRRRRGAS